MASLSKIVTCTLSDMREGQEADVFALLSTKEEATTRAGKPYFRVAFRDAGREIGFPLWHDSIYTEACRNEWAVGKFYKLRAILKESSYGPQLEIVKIREAVAADAKDGFDPAAMGPRSRFDSRVKFDELAAIAKKEIADAALASIVIELLVSHREALLALPAAVYNHHAFAGGYLEHVVGVTKNAVLLVDKYLADYPDLHTKLSKDLVVAGAILHDIGKLRELTVASTGAHYSPEGELIGHVLLGRDMLREAAAGKSLPAETLLRLEHIIVSHQRLPEWGAPKPPMTLEALLVHFADDLDAKLQTMLFALEQDTGDEPFTSNKNPMRYKIFRGLK
jgi:3'-5' exoribonuclease